MNVIFYIIVTVLGIYIISYILNWFSYEIIKRKTLNNKEWNLNICCGKTDGGGINADIVSHGKVKNFVLIDDIYDLPFRKDRFKNILCSHTIEHVEDPALFHKELQRVGKNITYLLPPIWDISAAFNLLEHKWLFLTFRSKHNQLPRYIRLPFTDFIHSKFGQKIDA